jgi:hypothetical protein
MDKVFVTVYPLQAIVPVTVQVSGVQVNSANEITGAVSVDLPLEYTDSSLSIPLKVVETVVEACGEVDVVFVTGIPNL